MSRSRTKKGEARVMFVLHISPYHMLQLLGSCFHLSTEMF